MTAPASAAVSVALIGPTHPLKGGVAAHTTELAHQLAQAGHEVQLISWSRRYLLLMQRWFIFPRESLLRHLPLHEQTLVYALALAPTLLPFLLVVGLLVWPSPLLAALLAGYFACSYLLFLHIDGAYLRRATPRRWSCLLPLLQVLLPLQVLAALLLPQRIVWRGHVMQVERGGGFRFVRRRSEP